MEPAEERVVAERLCCTHNQAWGEIWGTAWELPGLSIEAQNSHLSLSHSLSLHLLDASSCFLSQSFSETSPHLQIEHGQRSISCVFFFSRLFGGIHFHRIPPLLLGISTFHGWHGCHSLRKYSKSHNTNTKTSWKISWFHKTKHLFSQLA